MRIYGSREPTGTGPNDNKTNFIKRAKIINRLKPKGERERPQDDQTRDPFTILNL